MEGKLDETSRSHGCCFSAFGRSFGRSYRAASGAQTDDRRKACNESRSVGIGRESNDGGFIERGIRILCGAGNVGSNDDRIERGPRCNWSSSCERSARKFRGNGWRNLRGAPS